MKNRRPVSRRNAKEEAGKKRRRSAPAALTPEEKAARGALIKEFRETKKWSPEGLAERLQVHITAVYAFERAYYLPAAETYVKLANLAVGEDWKYADAFLDWAGVDEKTREQLADRYARETPALRGDTITLRPLFALDVSAPLVVPSAFVANPGSTRWLEIPKEDNDGEYLPFRPRDVLLIDTSQKDLHKIEGRAMIATWTVTDPSLSLAIDVALQPSHLGHIDIGWLQIEHSRSGDIAYYSLRRPADLRAVWLGASEGGLVPADSASTQVLGRIIAWLPEIAAARAERKSRQDKK